VGSKQAYQGSVPVCRIAEAIAAVATADHHKRKNNDIDTGHQ